MIQKINESEQLLKVLQYYNFIDGFAAEKMKLICPFHGDVNASLSIDLIRGKYYCFGCGASGNALDFITQMEECNSLQAMIILERILRNKKINKSVEISPVKKLNPEQALFEARRYYYSLPKTDWTKKSIAKEYMLKRGFTTELLQAVGAKENFNGDYGIIFPITENGNFINYVCRATNLETEKKRKYLYGEGFSRRNTLFGNYKADYVVIVEGSMDLFKLMQYGIKNAVAILGWKITKEQINKIYQYTDKVISALDNTETGEKGTEYLRNYFDVVRFKYPEYIKDTGDLDKYEFNKCWRDTVRKANKHGFNIEI